MIVRTMELPALSDFLPNSAASSASGRCAGQALNIITDAPISPTPPAALPHSNGAAAAGPAHPHLKTPEQHAEELVKQFTSFPEVGRHPRKAALEQQARAWLADLYSGRWPADRLERMQNFQLEVLGSVFYPRGLSDARSLSLFKIMYWLLLDDDVFDDAHLFGFDYKLAHRFACRQFRTVFGNDIKEAQAEGLIGPDGYDADIEEDPAAQKDELSKVQLDLVVEMAVQFASELQAQGLSQRQLERLREGFAEDLAGVTTVVRWRHEKRLPSLEEYVELRRRDGGSKLALLGCELDAGVELDDETLQHPLIQQLNVLTCNQILWINDLLSFKRESHNNDYVNLVGVLHYNKHIAESKEVAKATSGGGRSGGTDDFSEAIAEATSMIKACDQERTRLVHEIAAWRPDLQPYLDAINFGLSGLTYWTLLSPRYQELEPL